MTVLDISREGPVLKIWLNEPEQRNAVDTEALTELAKAFSAVQELHDVKVVELGAHGNVFCAGANLNRPPGIVGGSSRERRWTSRVGARALEAIDACEALTVARIQGPAVGGGLALALACDFRVMSTSAHFSLPEVALGVPLGWGSLSGLVSLVGPAKAREMLILNDPVSAQSALELGLVTRMVEPADLDDEVDRLISRLRSIPEYGVSVTKSQLRAIARTTGSIGWPDGDIFMLAAVGDHVAHPRLNAAMKRATTAVIADKDGEVAP